MRKTTAIWRKGVFLAAVIPLLVFAAAMFVVHDSCLWLFEWTERRIGGLGDWATGEKTLP